ncbi:hypothetical protein INR49_016011 [Caranx melampygus]|nr:hypothetical protein INR49_016011 [Caranx melampygus]
MSTPATKKNDMMQSSGNILNKLTPEKFDKLCLELLNVGVDSKLVLKGIILLIVDKALESRIYDKHDNPLTSEEEEQRAIAKIKMLGNIKFIGELGKLDLIHESILHKCIKTLLEKKEESPAQDMGEDLECLCQIMRTVGRDSTMRKQAPMSQGMRMDFFWKAPSCPTEELDRDSWGLADMQWDELARVIQDRYSPTMDVIEPTRSSTAMVPHIAPPTTVQFDMGPKSFC